MYIILYEIKFLFRQKTFTKKNNVSLINYYLFNKIEVLK